MNDINLTARQVADQWYRDWFAFNELYAQWAKRYGVNFTILFCLYAIYHSETAPTPGQVATKLCLSKQT
ncbi:MAG: MarR family transcriptional regulator, partial [Clostridia bacterium]|nr:MarR family transcriptional regulator [Clostridia bacterium]